MLGVVGQQCCVRLHGALDMKITHNRTQESKGAAADNCFVFISACMRESQWGRGIYNHDGRLIFRLRPLTADFSSLRLTDIKRRKMKGSFTKAQKLPALIWALTGVVKRLS